MFHRASGLYFFTFRGIDVRVSFWYLVLMALIVFSPGGATTPMAETVAHGLNFASALTLSLLVHEFGHALVSQYYRLRPSILLHGFGGLCMHESASTDGRDARILLAGPGAGLVLGILSVAALPTLVPAVGSAPFERFVVNLAWVNVVWSLINLMLPVWPLDGGKLFHLALRQFTSTERARNLALKISIMTTIGAGLLAVAVLQTFPIFVAIISFFIVVSNLQKLRGGAPLVQRSADGTREAAEANDEGTAPPLLDEAQQALERGDWSEAYRLTHQLRSSTRNLGSQTLDEIWTILSVAATKLGKYDEASTYVDRAPANARVQNARRELEHRRDDDR